MPGEAEDPLGEEHDSPVPGLVHRYPDRVLLLVLDYCSSYCRYCTRSRVVGQGEIVPSEERLEQALDCSFFTGEHAFILTMMLDSIDSLTAQIGVLDARIADMCQPYQRQLEQLDEIPGFGITTAQDLIAEIGRASCRERVSLNV